VSEESRAAGTWRLLGVVPAETEEAEGIDGITYVIHGAVAAAVVPHVEQAPVRDGLRDHALRVDQLFAAAPVLPARFGTLVRDPNRLVDMLLAPHQDELAATLQEVRDRVEVHVRIEQVDDAAVAEAVGRDPALRELAAGVQRQGVDAPHAARVQLGERIAQAVAALSTEDVQEATNRLADVAVSVRGEAPRSSSLLLDASYLVDRDRFDDFNSAVGELVESLGPRVSIRAVGPLAPYSFADLQVG
jgi:hypothetical protein